MSAPSIPRPTRHDPPCSARIPSHVQRAARARAETLGETYGQYLTRLICEDTADNVGPLIVHTDTECRPESEAS